MDFSAIRRSAMKRGTVQFRRSDITARQRENNDRLQRLLDRASGDVAILNVDDTHSQYICGVTPMDASVIVGTAP